MLERVHFILLNARKLPKPDTKLVPRPDLQHKLSRNTRALYSNPWEEVMPLDGQIICKAQAIDITELPCFFALPTTLPIQVFHQDCLLFYLNKINGAIFENFRKATKAQTVSKLLKENIFFIMHCI